MIVTTLTSWMTQNFNQAATELNLLSSLTWSVIYFEKYGVLYKSSFECVCTQVTVFYVISRYQ